MNELALISYITINLLMTLSCFRGKNKYYEFPFWAGAIGLGWFVPQAYGLLPKASNLPDGAYATGLFFASLCTVGLWAGFVSAVKHPQSQCWIDAEFDRSKLYYAGAFLVVFGFFFHWKLMSLPPEVLAATMWTGVAVKYLFLASLFKFGLLALWLLYLEKKSYFSARFLIFLVPSFLMILKAAFLRGRRAEMMDLASYTLVSLWFVRRILIPRWLLITAVAAGLIFINAIGLYRSIMKNEDMDLKERIALATQADYLKEAEGASDDNVEMRNYLYARQAYADEGMYDYGLCHWNLLIFNYVPAQIVGRTLKNALMIPMEDPYVYVKDKYGYMGATGSTTTGYKDAFGSFGWLGCIKFVLVGWLMGVLYRHAMNGAFLSQLLYIYGLATAMQVVTHQTNDILVRIWVYFFALAYPIFLFAKRKAPEV